MLPCGSLSRKAVFGCEKELDLTLKDTCETCHGTGANQAPHQRPVLNVMEPAR